MTPAADSNMSPAENLLAPTGVGTSELLKALTAFELESGRVQVVWPDKDDMTDYGNSLTALLGGLQEEHPGIVTGAAVVFEYKRPGDDYFNHMFVYGYANSDEEISALRQQLENMIAEAKSRGSNSSPRS
jgi:hypothetical protein